MFLYFLFKKSLLSTNPLNYFSRGDQRKIRFLLVAVAPLYKTVLLHNISNSKSGAINVQRKCL